MFLIIVKKSFFSLSHLRPKQWYVRIRNGKRGVVSSQRRLSVCQIGVADSPTRDVDILIFLHS